jgi:hypothetical protein
MAINGSSMFDFAEILQDTGLKMQMLGSLNLHIAQLYNTVGSID